MCILRLVLLVTNKIRLKKQLEPKKERVGGGLFDKELTLQIGNTSGFW